MKKIGFVDYYMSEWHANHYPAWIQKAAAEAGLDYEVSYAYAELETSPLDGVTTAQWCETFGVTACATLQELCEKSDVILVLAPTNPEKHLSYAKTVLPFGKPTYIDKTFAPDLATAKEIFAIGKAHGTPFFSTSALRYATELSDMKNPNHISVTGSGRSAEEYIVHQVEMVVTKLGIGAARVRAAQTGPLCRFEVVYGDGRSATMTYAKQKLPFTLYMTGEQESAVWKPVTSDFFALLIADILRFYEHRTVSFDMAEILEVMRIREGALKAAKTPDQWLTL